MWKYYFPITAQLCTFFWWLAIVGLLGILVGILTLAWPGITALVLLLFIAGALALLYVIGFYAVLYGILLVGLSLRLRRHAAS
jgi:hypothetical protein